MSFPCFFLPLLLLPAGCLWQVPQVMRRGNSSRTYRPRRTCSATRRSPFATAPTMSPGPTRQSPTSRPTWSPRRLRWAIRYGAVHRWYWLLTLSARKKRRICLICYLHGAAWRGRRDIIGSWLAFDFNYNWYWTLNPELEICSKVRFDYYTYCCYFAQIVFPPATASPLPHRHHLVIHPCIIYPPRQDNTSGKFFQGTRHTSSNMGEKVAQVCRHIRRSEIRSDRTHVNCVHTK